MKYISFFIIALITSVLLRTDAAWDKAAIDDYVESVRVCRERPAVTIAIIELDENGEIAQSYANAYGRVDPTCSTSTCNQVKHKRI